METLPSPIAFIVICWLCSERIHLVSTSANVWLATPRFEATKREGRKSFLGRVGCETSAELPQSAAVQGRNRLSPAILGRGKQPLLPTMSAPSWQAHDHAQECDKSL